MLAFMHNECNFLETLASKKHLNCCDECSKYIFEQFMKKRMSILVNCFWTFINIISLIHGKSIFPVSENHAIGTKLCICGLLGTLRCIRNGLAQGRLINDISLSSLYIYISTISTCELLTHRHNYLFRGEYLRCKMLKVW